MKEPYIGDITICSFSVEPRGWAFCDGRLLPIAQNQPLYLILGTAYGGDGVTNFALPDLRGRAPIGTGQGFTRGNQGGEERHALTEAEIPAHTHYATGTLNGANQASPAGNYWATVTEGLYGSAAPNAAFNNAANGVTGGGQSHENMPPFLTLNFIIALQGVFPSRN